MSSTNSASTSSTNSKMTERMKLASSSLAEHRDFDCSTVAEAVEELSEVCRVFAACHGEVAEECAEPYFHYGRALLELTKLESSVLANALEGFEIEEEEKADHSQVEDAETVAKDECFEIEEKVADAFEENFEQHDRVARAHVHEDSEEETSEDDSESEEENTEEEVSFKTTKEESCETEDEVVDSEEMGHLELAWEMLEMAKNIWSKKSQVTWECEALACLGDVSLQAENYQLAATDLASCLQKRIAALPADSRSIAETHYQLAVAQAHCAEWSKAEASLASAVTVLEARVKNFAKVDKTEKITMEIAEVEAIIAGIKERVTDFKDMEQGVFREDMVEVAASSKLASGLGVEGAVSAAKPMEVATAGTA